MKLIHVTDRGKPEEMTLEEFNAKLNAAQITLEMSGKEFHAIRDAVSQTRHTLEYWIGKHRKPVRELAGLDEDEACELISEKTDNEMGCLDEVELTLVTRSRGAILLSLKWLVLTSLISIITGRF